MKRINKIAYIPMALALTAMVGTGCNKLKDFGNTNVNPLGSTQPITGALLTNAETTLGNEITGLGSQAIRAGLYAQYYSETQYPDASLYQETSASVVANYATSIQDLQVVIRNNTNAATKSFSALSGSNINQIQIATILKVYLLWLATDKFGDIPYSEAFQGAAKFYPKYDAQEDVYKQMFADLKGAIAGFENGGIAVKGDIMYGGNIAKWKKFANSMRMSMAVRLSKVYPAPGGLAATEFNAAFIDPNGYINSNADNFTLNFPGGSYKNTWFNIYDGRSDYFFSKTMGDALSNMSDTRLQAYSSQNNPMPYGLTTALANNFTASGKKDTVLNIKFRQENSPLVIYSAAQSLLATAEGMERGWAPGKTTTDAKAAYDAGVTASFAQWQVTMAAGYLSGGKADYNTGTGGGSIGQSSYGSIPASSNANTATPLERIALQNWIAFFSNGIQGWSSWRRTGIPNLQPTAFATNSPKAIPRRFVYGTSEYSLNPEQVKAAAGKISGGDKMQSRVWWDKP